MARYQFDKTFEENFINVCNSSKSMAKAALELKMNYKTLCFHAKRLRCFKSNQSGKGCSKKPSKIPVDIQEIFNGNYVTYQSNKLKKRLLKENFKQHLCESCGLAKWLDNPIPLELHHVDGNRLNNSLTNLKLLCPNCHAFTENYRAKNIKNLSAQTETSDVESLKFGEVFAIKA
ncbi:MAG: HNH endonuclease signature motif containing protein [Runella sp.]